MALELSLYKLADAIQVPLTYENGKVWGEREAKLVSPLDFTLPFKIKARKFFMNEQCGVLAHVRGDLHLIISHFPATGSVSLYLIDGSKLFMDGVKAPPELYISKTNGMREVFTALKHAMVVAFAWKGNKWSPLKLPK